MSYRQKKLLVAGLLTFCTRTGAGAHLASPRRHAFHLSRLTRDGIRSDLSGSYGI